MRPHRFGPIIEAPPCRAEPLFQGNFQSCQSHDVPTRSLHFSENRMTRSGAPSERVAQEVKELLERDKRARRRVTGAAVRSAVLRAVRGTRLVGRGASNLAREAVEGAVRAVWEVGGEASSFVRDAVIGVVEGTGQVVTVSTPAVREVVVGAIRGSSRVSGEIGDVGRDAVEGAIAGAVSVGIDSAEAASAAVEGAVEAVVEAGGDLRDAATATVGGVVSGVAAAGGDVAAATREAAYTLVTHDAVAEHDQAEVAGMAGEAVDVALQEAEGSDAQIEEVVVAAATGVVEAAYEVSQSHGDSARRSVMRRVLEPRLAAAPDLQRRLAEVAETLSSELPRGRAAWRGASIVRAVRLLIQVGGIDLAASLAYFTILSLLPMVALVIMAIAIFGDPEGGRDRLTEVLTYYFPASSDLIREAVDNLLGGSLTVGLVAAVTIVLGANGLFLAANRSVNRVFGVERTRIAQITITQVALTTLVGTLFFLSVGLTASLQVVVSLGEGISDSQGLVSTAMALSLGIASAVLPAFLTAIVFVFLYRHLPNVHVDWRDATFGAMIAIVLFEIGKHLFFWFTGLATQRSAVYGPIASVVVLMMWGYIAGLIFLYGAALAKCAGEIRPTTLSKAADPD